MIISIHECKRLLLMSSSSTQFLSIRIGISRSLWIELVSDSVNSLNSMKFIVWMHSSKQLTSSCKNKRRFFRRACQVMVGLRGAAKWEESETERVGCLMKSLNLFRIILVECKECEALEMNIRMRFVIVAFTLLNIHCIICNSYPLNAIHWTSFTKTF